jgi:phosphomannomutase
VLKRVVDASPDTIAGRRLTGRDSLDGYRFEFDGGWLLVRPSGTEPLLRIYTETTDAALVQPVLAAGREIAGV